MLKNKAAAMQTQVSIQAATIIKRKKAAQLAVGLAWQSSSAHTYTAA
jgi:hypothetical protein